MLITSVYNMADTGVCSKIGTSASVRWAWLFPDGDHHQAIGFTFGTGLGNYISRLWGVKTNPAARIAANRFFTAFGLWVLLAILGLTNLDSLGMIALGATATIAPMQRIIFV